MPTNKKIGKVWYIHVMGHVTNIDSVLPIFLIFLYQYYLPRLPMCICSNSEYLKLYQKAALKRIGLVPTLPVGKKSWKTACILHPLRDSLGLITSKGRGIKTPALLSLIWMTLEGNTQRNA